MRTLPQMLSQVRHLQEELRKRLAEIAVEAAAAGGMVVVRMNGQKQLTAIHIDPEVWTTGDREMLQDLVRAAVNETTRKVDAELADRLKHLTGGLPFTLPGLV